MYIIKILFTLIILREIRDNIIQNKKQYIFIGYFAFSVTHE